MFKGFAPAYNGYPYGPTGMTSQKWLDIPVRYVPVWDLIATQAHIDLRIFIGEPRPPYGGDIYAHAVRWKDDLYLEDGHHRAVRAMYENHGLLAVRILEISEGANQ